MTAKNSYGCKQKSCGRSVVHLVSCLSVRSVLFVPGGSSLDPLIANSDIRLLNPVCSFDCSFACAFICASALFHYPLPT